MTVDVRTVHREFDVSMNMIVRAARAQGHSVPCREKCSACCYDIAFTTETEMGPIVEHIAKMSPYRQDKIRAAVVSWEKRVRGVGIDPDMEPIEPGDVASGDDPAFNTRARFYSAHAPCPLLDLERHRCMVYEERPIACRGHWLIDQPASVCGNVDKDPTTQNISNLEPMEAAVPLLLADRRFGLLPRILGRLLARREEVQP